MTDWQVVFLGIMAVALVVMAVMQIVTSLALLRASRQISDSVRDMQRDLRPLIDKATRMTDDAARLTAMALAQAERLDQVVTSLAARVEETVATVQDSIVKPMRQGGTAVAAFQAVLAAVREWKARSAASREDEGPLFVG